MILLDLFSGIGGFHKGLINAGFNFSKVYFSEINKHAIANYKYNYPYAEYIGTVEHVLNSGIKRPDIITFGSPCQDFSLAGKRAGLSGERSSLIDYALSAISHFRPDIFIWENVKGAFSSNNSEDFWSIIQAFANIGGYRLEWQLLNTVWFLPQNRERIYLVGRTAKQCIGEIFPIQENDEIFTKETGAKGGQQQTKFSSITLRAGNMKATDTFIIDANGRDEKTDSAVSGSILTTYYKGVEQYGSRPFIKDNNKNVSSENNDEIDVGTWRTHNDGKGFRKTSNNICPTIPSRAREDGSGQPVILQRARGNNKGNEFDVCPTISTKSFEQNNFISSYTRDEKGKIVNRNKRNICNTITSSTGKGGNTDVYVNNIRRLTEIECERLQGYPDNYTLYGDYDGEIKEIAGTNRYALIGNSVTTDVVRAVGLKIIENTKL